MLVCLQAAIDSRNEMLAGFDYALLELQDNILDALLDALPEEHHTVVTRLVTEEVERSRDGVSEC